jgi:predicted transcriptional regulator
MSKPIVEICAALVAAQASRTRQTPEQLAEGLQVLFKTLTDLSQRERQLTSPTEQRVEPQASIQHNQVVCLECGKAFQLLSTRHLALHGLNHRSYKEKYHIPMTQSLSSRTLSARRRKLAKDLGIDKSLAAWRRARKTNRRTG